MSVLISGVLVTPAGVPVPNAEITFTALTNGDSVLNGFSASVTTSATGAYSIPLELCSYSISIQANGQNMLYGSVSITENTTPSTINDLLAQAALEQSITPQIIVYFQEIQADVTTKLATMQALSTSATNAAATAVSARDAAAQYAQNLSAAVTAAQNASASAANSANSATVAKNAAETAAANAQNTLDGTMKKSANGSDIPDKATFRANLGLGNAVLTDTAQTITGLKTFTNGFMDQKSQVGRPTSISPIALTAVAQLNAMSIGEQIFVNGAASTARLIPTGVSSGWWIYKCLHKSDTTANSGLFFVISGGTQYIAVLGTDGAVLWYPVVNTVGAQTITGSKTFTAVPIMSWANPHIALEDTDIAEGTIGRVVRLFNSNGEFQVLRDPSMTSSTGRSTLKLPAAGTVMNLEDSQTVTGVKTFNSSVIVGANIASSAGLEMGNKNGNPTTPFIDFTSSGGTEDYSARMICTGGTAGTLGTGTLNVVAATFSWGGIPVTTTTGIQTLTNKTLTSPNLTGTPKINGVGIVADTNGFWKTASPIVKLFSDGFIETNDEAAGITAERVGTGEYKISGCLGFNADPEWGGIDGGIEIPLDINKQPLVWAQTGVEADGSIIIRTYHRTHPDAPEFARNNIDGMENGQPIDIPAGRWIDVRVQMPDADETSASEPLESESE